MTLRRQFTLAMAAAPFIVGSGLARAQANRRPITVVVPYTTGGSVDTLGRVFASALATQTGESVIVENRAGAGGTIGAAWVASQPGDGRTMLYTLGNLLLNQEFLLKSVKFRPVQSLLPLGKTCDLQVAIVTHASHAANNLADFITMAKRDPGKYTVATYGDLGVISMAAEAGITLTRVPYKGGMPGLIDVAAGNVDIIASSYTQAMPMLQAGKLKILAVMTTRRWAQYPNVRTIKEDLPSYMAVDYQGVFLTADTPQSIVDATWKSVSAAMATPEFKRSFLERGAFPDPMAPDEFKRFFLADHAFIKKTVETAGIQAE